ncbi:hypothetical protein GGI04_000080 [Coemansia thaxteri]|nr:hypothetical protein GGI04_000080 [Coemansia thaxteri]KAJ2474494.1 hypothetical protein GGI02_000021 [Coemansia sp. RSA 2322]KAJ2485652.1 hypothetical protein EV174_001590 [Coemansia sp. RSA 2320]
MDLDSESESVICSFSYWPRHMMAPDHGLFYLVKVLSLELDVADVLSGNAVTMLSRAQCNVFVFSRVRTLTFSFALSPSSIYDDDSSSQVEANIVAFVDRIKRLVPKVTKVSTTFNYPSESSATAFRYSGNLATRLYQLAPHIDYIDYTSAPPVVLNVDTIHNLVVYRSGQYLLAWCHFRFYGA